MLDIIYSKQFVKDSKKLKSNKYYDPEIFKKVIFCLMNEEKLEDRFKDHQLAGNLKDFRECHLKSDLLLI